MRKKRLASWLMTVLFLTGPSMGVSLLQESSSQDSSAFHVIEQYFTEKGFRSGAVKIPALDVGLLLKRHQFFKLEASIPDVNKRIAEIRKEFGVSFNENPKARGQGFCGVIDAEYQGVEAQAYFILIKKDLNLETRAYTLGHEYGHLLWYLDRQDLIFDRFTDPEKIRSSIFNSHDFAVLCSWTALRMACISLYDCVILFSPDKGASRRSEEIKRLVIQYYR